MKKSLFLLVLTCLFVSCSSDDDLNPSIQLTANDVEEFVYGETREFPVVLSEVTSTSFNTPNGWEAKIKNDKLIVTAPTKGTSGLVSSGAIDILAGSAKASLKVKAFYLVTFEDVNAKYLAGPTAEGENLASTYTGTNPERYTGYHDSSSDLYFNTDATAFYSGGIAISQWNDLTKDDYKNQCSVFFGDNNQKNGGNNKSKTFAVSYFSSFNDAPSMNFQTANAEHIIDHAYFTNSTYAALTMTNGNNYAKKLSYDAKDWFKLVVEGFSAAGKSTGTVEFFLADFRTQNAGGIVNQWKRVDLSSLGKVHKLSFTMDGSDKGEYGVNTPTYFCVDDIAVMQ